MPKANLKAKKKKKKSQYQSPLINHINPKKRQTHKHAPYKLRKVFT